MQLSASAASLGASDYSTVTQLERGPEAGFGPVRSSDTVRPTKRPSRPGQGHTGYGPVADMDATGGGSVSSGVSKDSDPARDSAGQGLARNNSGSLTDFELSVFLGGRPRPCAGVPPVCWAAAVPRRLSPIKVVESSRCCAS